MDEIKRHAAAESTATRGDTVAGYRLDLTRLLYMFYMDTEQQLTRADVKANLILTANSILLAALASFIAWRVRGAEESVEVVQLLVTLTPALAFSLLAAYFALSVAYPRMITPRQVSGHMFQSTAIASRSQADYVEHVLTAELDEVKREVLCGLHAKASQHFELDEVKREVLCGLHAKASILQVKFRLVRWGIACTVGAFVTTLCCLGLLIARG